jgi:hypothetical protein
MVQTGFNTKMVDTKQALLRSFLLIDGAHPRAEHIVLL